MKKKNTEICGGKLNVVLGKASLILLFSLIISVFGQAVQQSVEDGAPRFVRKTYVLQIKTGYPPRMILNELIRAGFAIKGIYKECLIIEPTEKLVLNGLLRDFRFAAFLSSDPERIKQFPNLHEQVKDQYNLIKNQQLLEMTSDNKSVEPDNLLAKVGSEENLSSKLSDNICTLDQLIKNKNLDHARPNLAIAQTNVSLQQQKRRLPQRLEPDRFAAPLIKSKELTHSPAAKGMSLADWLKRPVMTRECEPGSISGRVINSIGNALPGAYVSLCEASPPYNFLLTLDTDANGNYTFPDLEPGNYLLYLDASILPGYAEQFQWYNGKQTPETADSVMVTSNTTNTLSDVVFQAPGSITGRLVNSDGQGVMGVHVLADKFEFGNPAYTQSDSNGIYTLDNLSPGNYVIQLDPSDIPDYFPQWYNGKGDRTSADQVAVTSGTITTNPDVLLERGEDHIGRISGRVVDHTGQGMANVDVQLIMVDPWQTWAIQTDSTGHYLFEPIFEAGNYLLHFNARNIPGYTEQWYNGKAVLEEADPLTVSLGQTTIAADLIFTAPGSISGRVVNSQGEGVVGFNVMAYSENPPTETATQTDENGYYRFPALPASNYLLYFYPSDQIEYLPQYYDGKQSWEEADLVSVTSGNNTANIDVILDDAGIIKGKIVNSDGVGIPNVDVQLYSYGGSQKLRSVLTDALGRYTFGTLDLWCYQIKCVTFATTPDYTGEWYNNKSNGHEANSICFEENRGTFVADDIELVLGGVLSGRVTNGAGEGIGNINISLYAMPYNSNGYDDFNDSGRTDSNGYYQIKSLPGRGYRVSFFVPYGSSLPYPGEYYNDTYNSSEGQVVQVISNQTSSGIDATLQSGIIKGRVKSLEYGTGLSGLKVELYHSDSLYYHDRVNSNKNGDFQFSKLQRGAYKVKFYGDNILYAPQWYNNKLSFDEADLIEVIGDVDSTGIDAYLKTCCRIRGFVSADNIRLANVVMMGLPGNPMTDINGYYNCDLPRGWSGTVTPTLAGFLFAPLQTTYTNISGSQIYTDYTAIRVKTVTFQAGTNGSITGELIQNIPSGGNTSQMTALANSGYHFVNWTGTGGFFPTTANPLTVTNVTSNMTITANFAAGNVIPQAQRQALIDLYNSTHGDNWTNRSGWKTPPLHVDGFAIPGTEGTWAGVGIGTSGDTVKSLRRSIQNMIGTLPASLGNLPNLEYLDLSSNELTGTIPDSLGNLTQLLELKLGPNRMSGLIPPQLGNLVRVKYLDLSSNELIGPIPVTLSGMSELEILDLSNNKLSGTIPIELGGLRNLWLLTLANNKLTGEIPSQLGQLEHLKVLSLSINQLTGQIPPQLGNLSNLWNLELDQNALSGTIPSELGNLNNLISFHLEDNTLSGSIPPQLGLLTNLVTLKLNNNGLTGTIPSELRELYRLTKVDLSANRLTGEIPVSLINWQRLTPDSASISYNGLFALDSTLRDFLNEKCPGWAATQTIAPTHLTATATGPSSITLTWDAIPYTTDAGGYRVSYATTPGGPYTFFGQTANKSATSLQVTGLNSATTYYFVVKTHTEAHTADPDMYKNNKNIVDSEFSPEVSATTGVIQTLTILSPNGGETFTRGQPCTIAWTASGISGNLVIELLQNDVLVGVITSAVPASSGTFTWTLGRLENETFITGSNLKIRIRTPDGLTVAERRL